MNKRLSLWTSNLIPALNRQQKNSPKGDVPNEVSRPTSPARPLQPPRQGIQGTGAANTKPRHAISPNSSTDDSAVAIAERQKQVAQAQHDHLSVYATPEAWPRRFKEPQIKVEQQNPELPGRPRLSPEHRRRNTLSIAMSEAEEKAVRMAARDAGQSMSEWVRTAIFKRMGRGAPERDTRRRDWDKTTGEKD